jgi:hypothetical protein
LYLCEQEHVHSLLACFSVGGQIIIDVDWDTFTNSKNELRALQISNPI